VKERLLGITGFLLRLLPFPLHRPLPCFRHNNETLHYIIHCIQIAIRFSHQNLLVETTKKNFTPLSHHIKTLKNEGKSFSFVDLTSKKVHPAFSN
jgi:hypothetical protein